MNLRDFLRYFALGGIVTFAITQQTQRRRLETDPKCLRLNPCADCEKFVNCRDPKAIRTRGTVS